MAEFPAMPLWTDAYLGDTTHLNTFEHGAYLLLLMVSWRSPGCCLPDDDALLCRYARMTRDKWRKARPILEPFFRIDGGFWHQARLQNELQHLQSRREQQVAAGNASAVAKALKRKGRASTPVGQPLQRDAKELATPIPYPLSSNEQGKETPNGVSKKRGSRLSEDWQPTAEEIAFAKGLGLDNARIMDAAATYRDYWHAQPGQKGVKLDWPATWRNWCRREAKQRGNGHKQYVSASGFEYRGTPDEVRRKAVARRDLDTVWQVEQDQKEARSLGDVVGGIMQRHGNA